MPVIAVHPQDPHRMVHTSHATDYFTSSGTREPREEDLGSPRKASGSSVTGGSGASSRATPSTRLPKSTPMPTQPLPPVDTPTQDAPHESEYDREHESHAGPSHHHRQSSIPPPASARRHRSGVLMSAARSRAGSGGFRGGSGVIGSKSFGDLSLGLTMSSAEPGTQEEDAPVAKEFRRITSEGSRRTSADEDNMWDNSARFYHHLHSTSRPVSRQTSPERSQPPSTVATPARQISPSRSSSTSSPIHIRRSQVLPTNGPGPPMAMPPQQQPGHPVSALSPAHAFLQSHLPPLFPTPGSSPEHPGGQAMVILTPTTAEWKELKKEMGEELERVDSSGSSDRRSSLLSTASASSEDVKQAGLLLEDIPRMAGRPSFKSTMSADYIQRERMHTPDPGALPSPEQEQEAVLSFLTPDRPVFQQNIIAPSPLGENAARLASPVSPEHDPDQPIVFDRDGSEPPQRFASIGRRESLHAVPKSAVPKAKTKRELERERLFKDLDEDIEAEKGSSPPFEAVQQIGQGLKLSESGRILSPDEADAYVQRAQQARAGKHTQPPVTDLTEPSVSSAGADAVTPAHFEGNQKRQSSVDVSPKSKRSTGSLSAAGSGSTASLSPSTPFKPSPLHASPVFAVANLASPEESPDLEKAGSSSSAVAVENGTDSARPVIHTANLETIRDYARSLADHPEPASEISNPLSPAGSPTKGRRSPRLTHRRDTRRVSLVAGRVVQPFSVPPDTALPPSSSPEKAASSLAMRASLNSFSPFRTPPSLTPSQSTSTIPQAGSLTPHSGFPGFNRMDSTVSVAPSTGPPSEPGTPTSETVGGMGGRGIDDYVILSEAGKGAYGLVMRAKVKGQNSEPVGEEVIIKYIVKVRILADCWKKHKVLGPIPVEIHVMDQLRHLMYPTPSKPNPWDPTRARPGTALADGSDSTKDASVAPPSPTADGGKREITALEALQARNAQSESPSPALPGSPRSPSRSYSSSLSTSAQRYLASELRVSPERGHPNICKLLDFFEDREFYYMVMPRFGSGIDLFDTVEASPNGLPAFDVRSLIGQLADAVRFLHSNGIVHRDIKDENVILDGHGRCQLIDFGSAAHWRTGKRWDTFSGTLHYASPEILRGDLYGGKEQDVYALGTVLYVLLVGETPFAELPDEVLAGLHEGSRALEALQERCAAGHDGEEEEQDGGGRLQDAEDLVNRCLEMVVQDRPTAEMVCNHRFLKGKDGWKGYRGWAKAKN